MKNLSAAVVGTLVAFTWILLSRMTLPWYTHEFYPLLKPYGSIPNGWRKGLVIWRMVLCPLSP